MTWGAAADPLPSYGQGCDGLCHPHMLLLTSILSGRWQPALAQMLPLPPPCLPVCGQSCSPQTLGSVRIWCSPPSPAVHPSLCPAMLVTRWSSLPFPCSFSPLWVLACGREDGESGQWSVR